MKKENWLKLAAILLSLVVSAPAGYFVYNQTNFQLIFIIVGAVLSFVLFYFGFRYLFVLLVQVGKAINRFLDICCLPICETCTKQRYADHCDKKTRIYFRHKLYQPIQYLEIENNTHVAHCSMLFGDYNIVIHSVHLPLPNARKVGQSLPAPLESLDESIAHVHCPSRLLDATSIHSMP